MTRRTLTGFFIGLLFFLIVNLISAHLSSDCGLPAVFGLDSCADDIARAGWPLVFYEEGGFAYRHIYNIFALSFDFGLCLAFASTLGWLFARGIKEHQ